MNLHSMCTYQTYESHTRCNTRTYLMKGALSEKLVASLQAGIMICKEFHCAWSSII